MSGVGDSFQMARDELEQEACGPPTTHSLGTCLNLISWVPQSFSKTEISKWTFYKLLTGNQLQT